MKHLTIANFQRPHADTVQRMAEAGPTQDRWYEIKAEAGARTAEVRLYDAIGGWFGIYADEFLAELDQLDVDEINLHINSPGGSVFEGVAIYNGLINHQATVTAHIEGLAASIASVIVMAADTIKMSAAAQLMIHEASGICMGNAAEMEQMAGVLDKLSGQIAAVYAARTGASPASHREAMKAETWYTGDEAKAAGLVDEVIPLKAGPAREDDTEDAAPAARWLDVVAAYRGEHGPELVTLPAGAVITDGAVGVHHTATVDKPWSKSENETHLPSPMPLAKAKAAYAWYDAGQVEDGKIVKAACKFPHHMVSADGTVGAANLAACRNGLARIDSADIPAGDQAGVRSHLQAHLDDAGNGSDDGAGDQAHTDDAPARPVAPIDVLRRAMEGALT